MTEQISLLQAAAHPGNTEGVTATGPTQYYRPEKCEFAIDIGLFFDGTCNNQDWADSGRCRLSAVEYRHVEASAAFVLQHGIEPIEVQGRVAAVAVETGGAVLSDARFMATIESLRAAGTWHELMMWRAT
jgi:hypothetical protein